MVDASKGGSDSTFTALSTGDSHRSTLQARTTLLNVEIDELTPEQIIFFEDTWVQAFNKVLLGNDDGIPDKISSPKLRSFVVEEILKNPHHSQDGRALRNKRRQPRGISSYKWFDIWALMETSCRLCGNDDDRRLIMTRSIDRGDLVLQDIETHLCEGLRRGPFRSFHGVKECRIVYFEG